MGSSSKNSKQSFLPPGALVSGRGQSLKSMGSGRRILYGEAFEKKSEKEIGHNFTFVGSVKESIVRGSVENRIMVGNNKGLNSATYTQNVVAQKIKVVHPSFDALEDETSFPNDDLEVMQETVKSKPAKENGHNITSVCSVKGSNVVKRTSIGKSKNYCVPSSDESELAHNKNLMQPGFDPIEIDTFFPRDDLEVMGRGNIFTSMSSVRGGIGKRIMIGNNKSLNSIKYDQNIIPQKTNVVCPDFDAIEVETSFPHEDHEVMQENMRSKPGKENGKNIRSMGFARGKHDTSFPHDDLEAMQEALRSKSARERTQSFTYVGSPRRCAEKGTLTGKNKDCRNTEYDLNELTL
ncbi:hypothetical protein KY285_032954 [Solanum tuberosum]|nr:hypothetical protein KY289_033063 [Solanum tuberosum]KAH0647706.1 hypothetical protein KY285_032954 [Solanum tuberosum]